jgi:hypothetical protein
LRFLQLDLIKGETGIANPDALSADENDAIWERPATAMDDNGDV